MIFGNHVSFGRCGILKFQEISPLRHMSSTSLPSLSACERTNVNCPLGSNPKNTLSSPLLQDHAFPYGLQGLQFDKIWWMYFSWVQQGEGGKTSWNLFVKCLLGGKLRIPRLTSCQSDVPTHHFPKDVRGWWSIPGHWLLQIRNQIACWPKVLLF